MNNFDQDLLTFIKENTVASIGLTDKDGGVYALSCFFVFDEKTGTFIFKSSPGTHHGELIKHQGIVSGTILPDRLDPLKIRGIQFRGRIGEENMIDKFSYSARYYAKYPVGVTIPGYMWSIQADWIKFTDNTKGFGNKTIWNRT